MKRSRTGVALLFLLSLVVGFGVLFFVFSALSDSDEEGSGLADFFGYGTKIGVIEVEGTISTSDTILKQLKRFGKRSSIKAILLRINSPGGAVAPAQEIYRQIGKVRKKKPVVASIETVGTSAAYYIASNADQVVCSRGTITGSIGVIMVLAEIHKVIEKIGVNVNVIKAGKYKDIGSGVRPLTEEERKLLESFAQEVHEQFINDVATARKGKIEQEKLRTIADGSFFSGERAHKLGLVDTLGNFYDAVKIAGKLGGIEGDPELVYPKKRWGSYLDIVLESVTGVVSRATDASRLIQNLPVVR